LSFGFIPHESHLKNSPIKVGIHHQTFYFVLVSLSRIPGSASKSDTTHRQGFPISLVAYERIRDWRCFGKDTAREIREYLIPDFSNWKDHDSYRPPSSGCCEI
jgi:hypothetical protein